MNEYIKENKIIEAVVNDKVPKDIKKELEEANKNFEFAEGDLIDYYTYQIKANRAKFDYLLKKAKENGIAIDMIDQIDISFNQAI